MNEFLSKREPTEERIDDPEYQDYKDGPELEFDDLLFIHENSLGLRHLTTKEQADREASEGIEAGDAVAIANIYNLLREEDEKIIIKNHPALIKRASSIGYTVSEALSHIQKEEDIDPEVKRHLIEDFSDSIIKFFLESMGWDIRSLGDGDSQTAGQIIDKLIETGSTFLIIRSDHESPYDEKVYYGLGKYGKADIEPDDIIYKINLDKEDAQNFDPSNFPNLNELRKAAKYITQKFYAKFVAAIKTLNKN
ncbi:MAG: hypothetical protein WCV92_00440 [Candidatus Buchananbacteria bacterium]